MYSNDVRFGVIMILPIRDYYGKSIKFGQNGNNNDAKKSDPYDKDTLLENNLSTRLRIGLEKTTKAFTVYPSRGLKGSRNSNFYEFLTMGITPYILGSATLIGIFNGTNKVYPHFSTTKAAKLGHPMALGVVMYGIFKELSKTFITYPVKWKTGVDTEIPYAKVNYRLQESEKDDLTSTEYHKVGESVDFPRWDLLYGDTSKGENLNFRYDKIAKKNGLGTNLNDSDQEVKPIYKEILIKSKLAKSISSFLWAAVGVALAFQKPMSPYFKAATLKFWKPKQFLSQFKVFGEVFVESCKSLYKSAPDAENLFEKHAGKGLLGIASLSTILGILNTIHITKKPKSVNVIDKSKESVVC